MALAIVFVVALARPVSAASSASKSAGEFGTLSGRLYNSSAHVYGNITPLMIGLLVICALLLSCFFASLSILCSLYAKTVKEAQSMKLPVYGATMVLALVAMLRVGPVSKIFYTIPIYNICIVMQDVLSSAAELTKILITVLSLSVCTVLVGTVTVLSFKKEAVRC